MRFEVIPRGNRVVVHRGPAKTTYTFGSEEEALDFAEQTQEELIADAAARLDTLAKFADPDHPADPVVPHPAELDQARAELEALQTGGQLPPPLDPSTVEPDSDEDDEALRQRAMAAAAQGGTDPGPVTVRLEWDPDRDRVSASILNEGVTEAKVRREVVDDEGDVVRKGDMTIDPGREITRAYALDVTQTIRFSTTSGEPLGSFTRETNTDPGDDE